MGLVGGGCLDERDDVERIDITVTLGVRLGYERTGYQRVHRMEFTN